MHRSLPPQLSQMVANFLVFIVPIRYLGVWWNLRAQDPEASEEKITASASRAFFLTYLWARARDKWHSTELSDLLRRESVRYGLPELSTRSWRQIAVAIASHLFKAHRNGMDFEDDRDGDDEDGGFEDSDPWDQLGSHSTAVAERAYGVRSDIGYAKSEKLLVDHVRACRAWQAWLKIDQHHQLSEAGTGGSIAGSKHARSESSALMTNRAKRSLKTVAIQLRWTMDSVDRKVRRLFKTEAARYRSPEQRTALEHVVSGTSHILAVLPTGGGKSLLFQLPTLLAGARHTVVIIPFRALQDDLLKKCTELGIPSSRWDTGSRGRAMAGLIFASLEHVVQPAFHAFLQGLQAEESLDRIVLDECHLVLTEDAEYRPSLLSLNELRTHTVQTVCLTATLPVSEEGRFRELLSFGEGDLVVIRAPTSRFNLKIQCVAGGSWDASCKTAIDVLDTWKNCEENKSSRAVVFVNDRDIAEGMATDNDLLCYHAKMSKDDRSRAFENWRSAVKPRHRIMIATAALYQGVDLQTINLVIMLEPPNSVYHLIQAMGRGGRDGGNCTVRIIVSNRWRRRYTPQATASAALVDGFITAQGCRHLALSQGMDNMTESCDTDRPGLISCDNCARSSGKTLDWFDPDLPPVKAEGLPTVKAIEHKTVRTNEPKTYESLTRKQLRTGGELVRQVRAAAVDRTDSFQRGLLRFTQTCAICYAGTVLLGRLTGSPTPNHGFNQCGSRYAMMDARKQAMLDTNQRWLTSGICFTCLLPDKTCGREGSGTCTGKYKDVVLPLCWSAFHDERLRTSIPEAVRNTDLKRYMIWLGRRPGGDRDKCKTCNAAQLAEAVIALSEKKNP